MFGKGSEKEGFVHEKGVTYFSKRTEQRILFVMTLGMMLWGILEATNIF
jgi:hypothetical protein